MTRRDGNPRLLLSVEKPHDIPSFNDGEQALESAMDTGFQCAGCGQWNETSVDECAGSNQRYVEDCQVCCKPNVLVVFYDPDVQTFFITAQLE